MHKLVRILGMWAQHRQRCVCVIFGVKHTQPMTRKHTNNHTHRKFIYMYGISMLTIVIERTSDVASISLHSLYISRAYNFLLKQNSEEISFLQLEWVHFAIEYLGTGIVHCAGKVLKYLICCWFIHICSA